MQDNDSNNQPADQSVNPPENPLINGQPTGGVPQVDWNQPAVPVEPLTANPEPTSAFAPQSSQPSQGSEVSPSAAPEPSQPTAPMPPADGPDAPAPQPAQPDPTSPDAAHQPVETPTQPAPIADAVPAVNPQAVTTNDRASSMRSILFQILLCAAWTIFVAVMTWIVYAIANTFVAGGSAGDNFDSVLVLAVLVLPAALVLDFFFSLVTSDAEAKGSKVVKIIFGSLLALFGIGLTLMSLYLLIVMFITPDVGVDDKMALVATGIFGSVLSLGAFLRVMEIFASIKFKIGHGIIMLIVGVVVVIVATAEPMAAAIADRRDSRVEESAPIISNEISSFIGIKRRLPTSISEVNYSSDEVKQFIDEGLISFEPLDKKSVDDAEVFRYKLCVHYARTSDGYADLSKETKTTTKDSFRTYLSTGVHPAGDVCYRMAKVVR